MLGLLVALGARSMERRAGRGDGPMERSADYRSGGQRMETSSRAAGSGGKVPEAITISQEFEIDLPEDEAHKDEDVDALINYLEDEEHGGSVAPGGAGVDRAERPGDAGASQKPAALDGFYCPPGLEEAPVVYVDPKHGAAEDEAIDLSLGEPEDGLAGEGERANNPERPFVTIGAALEYAGELNMGGGRPVQVRVMPGVYQESVVVPAGVSLINHRLPAEGSVRQHLQWLVGQDEVDHPDRVTILPPADAAYAVGFASGRGAGIFGCYMVGREGVDQCGVVAGDCLNLSVVYCAVEDFSDGGMNLERCGGSIMKTAAQIVGCRLRNNRARRGGAVVATGGTLRLEKTRLEHNRAKVGGALCVEDLTGPLHLVEVGFRKNEALSSDSLTVRPDVVRLQDWQQGTGLGGALAVIRSKAKLGDCKFVENRAKIAGGAAAFIGAQIVLSARGSGNSFKHNRARVGAGAFVVGWLGCRATLKASGVKFIDNAAGSDGGGLAVVGLAVAQIVEAKFHDNSSGEAAGLGGAVCCLKGGQFMAKETHFRANVSAGSGGSVGAVNASVVLSDGCIVEDSVAEGGDGGGVLCLSRSDEEMEKLMGRSEFKLPLVFTTRDVSIRNNRASGRGGGVRVGNAEEVGTFPIKVRVEAIVRVRNNEGAGGDGDDVVGVWKGRDVRVDGEVLLN